ncbi:alpha/beta fold hydrolase [Streptomyces sp. SM14]|uniref:alpha/beta fold hydrolase n=1 Tax=Streptomyces sp. SM14 TaxID=1736045 RepID=UPI002156420F|nr:alpha/beta hydrolase [Streptomyces sp. SM14]
MTTDMRRAFPRTDGPTLICEDYGGDGPTVVALHGTFGRGSVFARLADDLAGAARIVASDQRGHGSTGAAGSYRREDFVTDAAALVRALDSGPVVVLGHSLGGITAYQLAARHPELVAGLVIEDVGPLMRRPEIEHPVLEVRGWPRTAPTRAALAAAIEERGVPDSSYFLRSAVETPDGWRLLFDWEDMAEVQARGTGDWWADWLGSHCPARVLRGGRSTLLPAHLAAEMVRRRPDTDLLVHPEAGHWIHDDDPGWFARAVAEFLAVPLSVGGGGVTP